MVLCSSFKHMGNRSFAVDMYDQGDLMQIFKDHFILNYCNYYVDKGVHCLSPSDYYFYFF